VLECFQNDDLDAIKIEPWKGKVKEVYFYKHNRIFFVIQNSQTVYILHACRKQKNKTERKDVKIVESRAKELFTELKKRGN
jgi:phage-related protein